MEYLAILAFILLAFSFLKYRYRILLFKSKKEALKFFLSCLLIGVAWDSFGILRGHWSLEGKYLVGIWAGVLPIEEYLFITILPFSVALLYKIITKTTSLEKQQQLYI